MLSKSLLAAAAVALCLGGAAVAQSSAPAAILAAVSDSARPAADVQRDAERKPAEMLVFAQVRPGEVVGELLPGGGYFTRVFAKAVRANGRVYAILPDMQTSTTPPPVEKIAADPAYANVKVVRAKFAAFSLPEKADLIWTSQNYHDLHLAKMQLDVAAFNKGVYDSLKPGGLFVIVDHAAAAGTGLDIPDKLHRIDPAIVRREVEAAGFQFVGESQVLRNPADDHTKLVFDPAIRGHTDQFIYKFRKPA